MLQKSREKGHRQLVYLPALGINDEAEVQLEYFPSSESGGQKHTRTMDV
jgi:hypothetical protein